jgi:hypothetical protein
MTTDDPYLVQLRRELTRTQAQLRRAERQRDQLAEQNEALRALLKANGIDVPLVPM